MLLVVVVVVLLLLSGSCGAGLFPTHDPSKTQKKLFKFNPHQSAPPQLFIYFRGCELAAPLKNNIFAA